MSGQVAARSQNKPSRLRQQLVGGFGIILGLFVLIVVFSILTPVFLSLDNLRAIVTQSGTNAIIAAGMTFVILAGEIDLSVGATLALTSVVGAQIMVNSGSAALGILVACALGIVLGSINGAFVARLGFPSFIVTLSTMWLFRGTAYVYTEGQAVVNLPQSNMNLSLGSFFYFPYIGWVVVVTFVICYFVLRHVTFGRRVYAVGDSRESARLSGINVRAIKLAVFSIAGFLSALGGVVLMSRLNSGQPVAGLGYELSAIAAAVIGGTSLNKGGVGGISGTLIGALFIGTLQNGLVLLNVTSFWQQVLMGIVVLLAVGMDKYRKTLST